MDLADNRPGAAARAKALEVRRAAPVCSRIARLLGFHTEERAWRIGADGEEDVGRRLAKLGGDWRVLHAVPVGTKDSDIDHVVIGPPGVFTLNTKNHPGKHIWVAERALMVSGQRTDYLPNSTFEARRANKFLSAACGYDVPVEPVIVLMAEKLTIKAAPEDVHVVARRGIVKWLKQRPPTLTPEGIAEV
ncbi:MAG: nuclease-related domain-containing protein, partial [Actinomycetes bacterium]